MTHTTVLWATGLQPRHTCPKKMRQRTEQFGVVGDRLTSNIVLPGDRITCSAADSRQTMTSVETARFYSITSTTTAEMVSMYLTAYAALNKVDIDTFRSTFTTAVTGRGGSLGRLEYKLHVASGGLSPLPRSSACPYVLVHSLQMRPTVQPTSISTGTAVSSQRQSTRHT